MSTNTPRRPKRIRIVATIYDKKGRILSVGHNSYTKTHPLMMYYGRRCGCMNQPYLHAEVDAIVKLKGGVPYKILIERYNKNGEPKLAAPCKICQEAIRDTGIKRIEYTVG